MKSGKDYGMLQQLSKVWILLGQNFIFQQKTVGCLFLFTLLDDFCRYLMTAIFFSILIL